MTSLNKLWKRSLDSLNSLCDNQICGNCVYDDFCNRRWPVLKVVLLTVMENVFVVRVQ